MNKLELKAELHTAEIGDDVYFVTAILVDGEAIADFSNYATFLTELKQSTERAGNYFILTCWCGMPECAGIYEGIQVVHGPDTVEWIVSQPPPRRVFTFDSSEYQRAIIFGIEQIRRDVANFWFTTSGIKDDTLHLVPNLEPDITLLEPKLRLRKRHRNS